MREQTANALTAARDLRTLILENRHVTEANRQVAEPIVAGLIKSKLGRMALPVDNGGLAVPPGDALEIYETLAEVEASVAWIVWNSSLPCWLSRFLSEDVRREIFGDPSALYASSTRPSGRAVKDGESYIVNGRWSLVSGCMHASWIAVMCKVEVNGQVEMLAPNVPHMRFVYFPRDEHEILDTWNAGGLRGTGSHDSVLRNASAAASRSFAIGDASLMESPMGRMPIACTMSAGCASICLGIAKSSLEALLELGAEKVPVDGGPGLRDRAPVQSLVARVDTQLHGMRERLRDTCETLWNAACSGDEIRPGDIAAVLGAAILTGQQCRAAVTEIYAAAGTSSLYTDCPIERGHRDIHAVMQHITLQPFWLEQAGRVSLGLEPTHPLFLL
jgi:alkylation response protein AidB-like acyl-CoA dehydrogenase